MAYSNNRGGNAGSQQSNRGGRPSNYLRSSSFVKTLIFDGPEGIPPEKEKVSLEVGVTEEIALSFTAEKAQEFIERLTAAINDPQGDGGVRMTLYCQHRTNKETGEEFDGASMILVGKFPPKGGNNFGKGSFSRGGSNRGGGNGRREYPAQSNRGGGSSQGQQGSRDNRPTNNDYKGPSSRPTKSATKEVEETSSQSGEFSETPGW